jgi:hypothetical protein
VLVLSAGGCCRPAEEPAEGAEKKTEAELQAAQEAANKEQQAVLKAALAKITVRAEETSSLILLVFMVELHVLAHSLSRTLSFIERSDRESPCVLCVISVHVVIRGSLDRVVELCLCCGVPVPLRTVIPDSGRLH